MLSQKEIRSLLLVFCFVFLAIIFILKKQDTKLNWSIFFSSLWVFASLGIVNYICVEYNLWTYYDENNLDLKIPLDLFFLWIIFWGVLPIYFFKGKNITILAITLFWLDIILMPELEKLGILKLNKNWYIGEVLLIILVWLPSYLWAKFYLNDSYLKIRASFQVLLMAMLLTLIIPFAIKIHTDNNFILPEFNSYYFQLTLIITFPALVAVIDLYSKGNGTPFPYDKTKTLVKNGVYAYCRNPIQWSLSIVFIPLAIIYDSLLLSFGLVVSVAYTIGISNREETENMYSRYGEDWIEYKKNTPSWRFLWTPKHIPKGIIYFKKNCNQCEGVKKWFSNKNICNLEIKYSNQYKTQNLLQVTYVDYNGNTYKSVSAIAHALEHINLIYASLGWFMRFPIIHYVLQATINSMDFNTSESYCSKK